LTLIKCPCVYNSLLKKENKTLAPHGAKPPPEGTPFLLHFFQKWIFQRWITTIL
jgi:hypothetical protein